MEKCSSYVMVSTLWKEMLSHTHLAPRRPLDGGGQHGAFIRVLCVPEDLLLRGREAEGACSIVVGGGRVKL